jgi:DNA-binding NarL/FixJ family response regulator
VTGQKRIRIVIADNQSEIRHGYRLLLNAQPDMLVVGEAAGSTTALDRVVDLRPDVVVADGCMPRLDGLALVRRLAGPDAPHPTRVIVLTTSDRDEHVLTALRDGARGFVLKRSGPALLVEAIRAAMAGDTLISPQLTACLLRTLLARTRPPDSPALTNREVEIARAVAHGLTNSEIAHRLSITLGTVKSHIANIQGKIGSRNRVGIAAWVWRHGLASPDELVGSATRAGTTSERRW